MQSKFTKMSLSQGPVKESYVMNGSKGYCYVCNIELTSTSHCSQHISGAKHIKKERDKHGSAPYNSNIHNPNVQSLLQRSVPQSNESYNLNSGAESFSKLASQVSTVSPSNYSANQPQLGISYQPPQHQPPQFNSYIHQNALPNRPSPSAMLQGKEAYLMNGEGYCNVCSLKLTSWEHAQSHFNGAKHKKKCGTDSTFASGLSVPTGKVLMCSICSVPFSCVKNAEDHFKSDKHKKRAALVPKDYSQDIEQTSVTKPFPSNNMVFIKSTEEYAKSMSPSSVNLGINCLEGQRSFVSYKMPFENYNQPLNKSELHHGKSDFGAVMNPLEYYEVMEKARENSGYLHFEERTFLQDASSKVFAEQTAVIGTPVTQSSSYVGSNNAQTAICLATSCSSSCSPNDNCVLKKVVQSSSTLPSHWQVQNENVNNFKEMISLPPGGSDYNLKETSPDISKVKNKTVSPVEDLGSALEINSISQIMQTSQSPPSSDFDNTKHAILSEPLTLDASSHGTPNRPQQAAHFSSNHQCQTQPGLTVPDSYKSNLTTLAAQEKHDNTCTALGFSNLSENYNHFVVNDEKLSKSNLSNFQAGVPQVGKSNPQLKSEANWPSSNLLQESNLQRVGAKEQTYQENATNQQGNNNQLKHIKLLNMGDGILRIGQMHLYDNFTLAPERAEYLLKGINVNNLQNTLSFRHNDDISMQQLPTTSPLHKMSSDMLLSNGLNNAFSGREQSQETDAVNEEKYYYFDGSRGFCHACSIELTSFQHANQHLNGQKHQKKMQQRKFTELLQRESEKEQPLVSSTALIPKLPAASRVSEENYFIFDGNRGMCHVCSIELTSVQHAKQHTSGKSHQRNVERHKLMRQGIKYPMFCDVCSKHFTGTESAAQHFTSSKHKSKAQLAAMDPVQKVDGGSVVIKDGQTWYMCDVCLCVVNTREQLRIHRELAKHNHQDTDCRPPMIAQESSNFSGGSSIFNATGCTGAIREDTLPENVLSSNQQHLTYGEMPKINVDKIPPSNARTASPSLSSELAYQNTSHTPSLVRGHPILGNSAAALQSEADITTRPVENCTPLSPEESQGHQILHSSLAFAAHVSRNERQSSYNSSSSSGSYGIFCANGEIKRSTEQLNKSSLADTVGSLREYVRSNSETVSEASDGYYSATSSMDQSGNSDYIRKPPSKPRRFNRSSVDRGTLSLDRQESELYSDDDWDEEERTNYNIQEEDPVVKSTMAEVVSPQPERSTKLGFRYFCRVCNKHMNTRANYEAHIAGNNHMYMSSIQKAEIRQLPPIRKCFREDYEEVLKQALFFTKTFPRCYQTELLHKTLMGDKIVYLPTGTGKTLVAVMTMAYMLKQNPSRPVLFLVDKVLLVLQQAKYIIEQFKEKKITRYDDSNQLIEREVFVRAICRGLTSKSDRPIWKCDILVTTAAFCQNMLERQLIRWGDFSLVVLDEVHHCKQLHPYFKLVDKYHNILHPDSRPKILGLTASPAGKSSVRETYIMVKGLLQNLGNAKIAVVEKEMDNLMIFQSAAQIDAICVPLSSKEKEFRKHLIEFIVLCYSRFAPLSTLKDNIRAPCSFLLEAVRYPGDRQVALKIAENFILDESPLSELLVPINTAHCLRQEDDEKFKFLQRILIELLFILPEVGTGAEFIKDLIKILDDFAEDFEALRLPCRELHEKVKQFEIDGNKDLTMFSKLMEILQNKKYIDWSQPSCKALILVRERKIARQLSHKLRREPVIEIQQLKVTHLVGHGTGAQDQGMDVKKQKRVLDNQEKYNIVVATSIMEEGIDFQSLQLVIAMNPPTSYRALVQIRGRARKKGSHFVILCSSEEEVNKLSELQSQEKNMQEAARLCIDEDRPGGW